MKKPNTSYLYHLLLSVLAFVLWLPACHLSANSTRLLAHFADGSDSLSNHATWVTGIQSVSKIEWTGRSGAAQGNGGLRHIFSTTAGEFPTAGSGTDNWWIASGLENAVGTEETGTYFTFHLAASAGNVFNLETLSFDFGASNDRTSTTVLGIGYVVFISVNNGPFEVVDLNSHGVSVGSKENQFTSINPLSLASYANVATVSIRIGYLTTLSAQKTQVGAMVSNIRLTGTVTEPGNSSSGGSSLAVGSAQLESGDNYPAYLLQVNSALGVTVIDQIAYGENTSWNWLIANGQSSQLLLNMEDSGKLSLYNPYNPGTPAIVLNASGDAPEITIAGQKVMTEGNVGTVVANSVTNSSGTIVLGQGSSAGDSSVVIGQDVHTNYDSVALGVHIDAEYSAYSVVLGSHTIAKSYGNVALGYYANATGESSIAQGSYATALGKASISLGVGTRAAGDYSIAIGEGAFSSEPKQVVLGFYNAPIENSAFVIGNGNGQFGGASNQYSNLFVIMKDGRGVFRSTNFVEPTIENPNPAQPLALTVEGAAEVKGTLRVRPAGDLSMGIFTAGEQP